MKREQFSGTFLSAVFVDYDNIYLSLKRKSDEAAKRFAKDAAVWVKAIETGSLITPTNAPISDGARRIVMNRCYGNPVPRRNQADNSTDMSSFPFVRHHFLRAGFEIVDCPPLTAQLKNSSDIRMVMDVRDYLTHDTYFDEFVILSGDADFTPVLHRLRAHARRTVIFANDYTAAPYTAISDGEIREADLITLLLEGRVGAAGVPEGNQRADVAQIETARRDIIADVVASVRGSATPVPLEVLADRAIRNVGHERTVGTAWGGAGGFRDLLAQALPDGLRMSGEAPFVVIDSARHLAPAIQQQPAAVAALPAVTATPLVPAPEPRAERVPAQSAAPAQSFQTQPAHVAREAYPSRQREAAPTQSVPSRQPHPMAQQPVFAAPVQAQAPVSQPPAMPAATAPIARAKPQQEMMQAPPAMSRQAEAQSQIQQSIARIHEACQAPPLAPPEYRILFECMAQELNENGLIGAQTIQNVTQRVQARGIEARRDDVRFVLEVVSEADPWFEQGASANLFAGRFRNFVVARCRSQGLNLSADELDLIEAWFAGASPVAAAPQAAQQTRAAAPPEPVAHPARSIPVSEARAVWEDERAAMAEPPRQHRQPLQQQPLHQQQMPDAAGEDFPRIVRTRLRG